MRFITAMLAISLLSIQAFTQVHALTLYDNFETVPLLISPSKWFGTEFRGGEVIRFIAPDPLVSTNHILRLYHRAYGGITTNSGVFNRNNSLNFSASPTTIQAKVRVAAVASTGCTGNPAVSSAQARLVGDFFNTSTPTSGSAVNDMLAGIRIIRESNSTQPSNVLEISYFAFLCGNADCSSGTSIGNASLGTINVGQTASLLLNWDSINNRFIFQRDTNPQVILPYTVSDAGSPGRLNKRLSIETFIVNCTTNPRPQSVMDVYFDDVFTN